LAKYWRKVNRPEDAVYPAYGSHTKTTDLNCSLWAKAMCRRRHWFDYLPAFLRGRFITDRSKELKDSRERNTEATPGPSTTETVPAFI
jgi:hypothetical protein